MFSCNHLLLAWVISAFATLNTSAQQSPMSTFRRKLDLPAGLEILCSHVQGSQNFGGHGRLSYVAMSTNSTSNQHLVLVDEKYSQLHQGGLVSRSSCRWSWPFLHLRPSGKFWSSVENCLRVALQPLDSRRFGLALDTSDDENDKEELHSLQLLILDVTNCSWTKVGELQQPRHFHVFLDLSLWMLKRHSRGSRNMLEVVFNQEVWQDPSRKCISNATFCALAFDAMSGEKLGEPRSVRLQSIKLGEVIGIKLLPVRSGASASLDGGYIVLIETTDDLIMEVFDFEGSLASRVREPRPKGSLQLVVQTTHDEDYQQVAPEGKLGPLLRYCWLLEDGKAQCISRGPALDLRSNVSLNLGYEGSNSGSLLEIPRLGSSGEDFLLLTRGGIGRDDGETQEALYYLTRIRNDGVDSSQWQRTLPLEMTLSFGPGKPFLASRDAHSDSYCSIGSTPTWGGRKIEVEIRCVPLSLLLNPDE